MKKILLALSLLCLCSNAHAGFFGPGLRTGAVTTAKLANDAVTSIKIADGEVTTPKLGDASVDSQAILDGTILAGDIASNAITEAKILNGAVTTAKLEADSVTSIKLLSNEDGLVKVSGGAMVALAGGNVGINRAAPDSRLHISADVPGTVGSHSAGQLIIQNPGDDVDGNVVITGYESDSSGNPDQQLWYFGSSSNSNEDITFLNRRNASLMLGTNNSTQFTVDELGEVGINDITPDSMLDVVANNASSSGTVITAAASQTAHLLSIRNSSEADLVVIDETGALILGTATPDVTPGVNDLFITGTLEVDGASRFDGTVTLPANTVVEATITDAAVTSIKLGSDFVVYSSNCENVAAEVVGQFCIDSGETISPLHVSTSLITGGMVPVVLSEVTEPYADMHISTSNAAATTVGTQNTFVAIAGTCDADHLIQFNEDTNCRLTYTGVDDHVASVTCAMSLTTAGTNDVIHVRIVKNGVPTQVGAEDHSAPAFIGTGSDQTPVTVIRDLSLVTDDFIEVYLTNTSAAANVTVEYLTCEVTGI